MLLNAYHNYRNTVEKYLKDTIIKIQNKIDEMEMIKKIKSVLPKYLQSNPNDPDLIITGCSNDTGIPEETVKSLFDKYNISRLLKVHIDIESEIINKQNVVDKLNNLENYIWDEKYLGA
jgi:hypothetical protein